MKNISQITKIELLVVFIVFVLSRLPSLGYDTFNTDVWKWKARTYDFSSGVFNLNFPQTIQKYHPGVTLMWLGTVAIKVYNLYYDIVYKHPPVDNDITTVFELNFLQKLFIVVALGAVYASIYNVLASLFGRKYGVISILLLILEPFNIALTREIHLEGMMSAFMLASFLWLYYFLEDRTRTRRIVLSGIFGALAVLTKTSSIFVMLFVPFISFVYYFFELPAFSSAFKLSLNNFYKWLLVFATAFILIWPAMWVVPMDALQTLYRGIHDIGIEGGHEQFYFGKFVEDPGVSFYYVVLLVRSSLYLLVGFFGYILFARRSFDTKTHRFVLAAILFAGLYFLEITLSTKKLDRYLLPSILSLLLVAAVFYEWLLSKASGLFNLALVWIFIPAVLLAVQLAPDYFSYYSPLVGGLQNGIRILEPKWMIGQSQIASYFQDLKFNEGVKPFEKNESMDNLLNSPAINDKLTVGFQEKYYTQIWPFITRVGGRAVIKDLTPQAVKTKYFVYPVWDDEAGNEDRFKLQLIGTIKLRGVDVYRVYKRV